MTKPGFSGRSVLLRPADQVPDVRLPGGRIFPVKQFPPVDARLAAGRFGQGFRAEGFVPANYRELQSAVAGQFGFLGVLRYLPPPLVPDT